MKRFFLLILVLVPAFLLAVSCNGKEDQEAYPGEKTLENTVWSYYSSPLSTSSEMYVIIWNYDVPADLLVKNAEGKGVSCTGKVVYEDSTRKVTISGIKPRKEGDSVPDKMTGSVSASGLQLSWSCGDVAYDCLFTYDCPADRLSGN